MKGLESYKALVRYLYRILSILHILLGPWKSIQRIRCHLIDGSSDGTNTRVSLRAGLVPEKGGLVINDKTLYEVDVTDSCAPFDARKEPKTWPI